MTSTTIPEGSRFREEKRPDTDVIGRMIQLMSQITGSRMQSVLISGKLRDLQLRDQLNLEGLGGISVMDFPGT